VVGAIVVGAIVVGAIVVGAIVEHGLTGRTPSEGTRQHPAQSCVDFEETTG
jgi:hypothetical protein